MNSFRKPFLFENNKLFLLWWLSILAVFLLNNDNLSLWDQDEAAYAGFAFNMVESGNWLIPDFMWSADHRKTPLHFWAIAASYKIFGINEFAVRFPSVLSILLTGFFLWKLGKEIVGESVARLATVVLLSGYFLANLAKISVTDSLLLLFETVSLLSLWLVLLKGKWKYVFYFWLAFSLGVLVKGPPIIIATMGMLGLVFIFDKRRMNLIKLHPWFFMSLAVLPLLIWGRLVWLKDDGVFIKWMVDWYILKRVSGSVFGQTGPPGYYLIIFLLGFIPWLGYLFPAFVNMLKSMVNKRNLDVYIPILCWIIPTWLFYEILPSKLPSYSIAAWPALSILVAFEIKSILEKQAFRSTSSNIGIGLSVLLSFMLSIVAFLASWFVIENSILQILCYLASVLMFVQVIYQFYLLKKNEIEKSILLCSFFPSLFLIILWSTIMNDIDTKRGATREVALLTDVYVENGFQIIMGSDYALPSLPFYLKIKKLVPIQSSNLDLMNEQMKDQNAKAAILNQKDYQYLTDINKIALFPIGKWHVVSGWVSDMGKTVDYFVFIKN